MVTTALAPQTLLSLLVAAALFSCGRTDMVDPDPPVTPTEAHDTRFQGLWMVDQPTHAGYEASFYDFLDDGRLVHRGTWGFDSQVRATGTVSPSPWDALVCEFGARWHNVDATLIIEGLCTDGVSRPIELLFSSPASQNTVAAEVSIAAVGGQPGWVHPGFDWRILKCPPGAVPGPGLNGCE